MYIYRLTVVTVAVATAGDNHSVRHQIVTDGTEQLIGDRIGLVLGGRLLPGDERGTLFLTQCIRLTIGHTNTQH